MTASFRSLANASQFGLGESTELERIEVNWPSGVKQVVVNPQVDTTLVVTEGSNDVVFLPSQNRRVVASTMNRQSDEPSKAENDRLKTICFSMIALPATTYRDLSGLETLFLNPRLDLLTDLQDGRSTASRKNDTRLVLVNLWAGWCSPCVEELKEISMQARRLSASGIDVVALSVSGLGENVVGADETRLLSEMKFPFRAGVADENLVTKLQMLNDTLFEVREPLPIPTSFLIDKKRRVLIVYKGPVSVDELLGDAKRIGVKTTEEWRAVTVPFPGRWIATPKRRHLFHLVEQLTDRGFVNEARDYVQRNQKMFVEDPRWPELRQRLSNRD